MKTKFLLFVVFLMAFSVAGFAQVKVSTKKVDYKRPNTVEMEHKRSFYIVYPKISGANAAKIEAILNYEKTFNFKLSEQQKGEDFWLDSCDFVVNYNKNNILGVELYMEGSGAYPSTSIKRFVINAKNGTSVKPADVFIKTVELAAMVKKSQTAEIKKANEEYKKDADSKDLVNNEYFKGANFKAENLQFFDISDKGIKFYYDYQFPHAILALQPSGEYFFSWKQLKPFIKSDGLFAQFVK